ncbi:hypothetical protein KONIH1_15175 [Klebsiella oxytoca KONIH1]|nr:hypothetical protein KONIH1_15175 [Klebsiella oxytoca KONIH1]
MLEDHAGTQPVLAQRGFIHPGNIVPVHNNAARRGPLQQIQAAYQRTFACTAAAEDAVNGSSRHLQRDIV